jgi:chromosome segregation ATPase
MNQSNSDGVATKKDLAALEERLSNKIATTKSELLGTLATKEELMATNKQLAKTNDRLDRIAIIVVQNNEDIKDIKKILSSNLPKLDMLLEAVTDLAGEIKDNRLEKVATDATLTQQANQLQNHEKRILKLEQKVA